jgi:hypothetical protein|tara:strand:+ start:19 stop:204 length:186 start_codon:yes stop_codon:yes gene_type:complete
MPENGILRSVNSLLSTCRLHVVGVELDSIDIEMQLCGVIKNVTKEYIALKNISIPLDVIKG